MHTLAVLDLFSGSVGVPGSALRVRKLVCTLMHPPEESGCPAGSSNGVCDEEENLCSVCLCSCCSRRSTKPRCSTWRARLISCTTISSSSFDQGEPYLMHSSEWQTSKIQIRQSDTGAGFGTARELWAVLPIHQATAGHLQKILSRVHFLHDC